MKTVNHKKIINILFICLSCCLLLSSCQKNKEKVIFEKTVEFPDSNWDFTQRILEFDATVSDTIAPHRIEMELKYGPDNERVDEMPVSFAIFTPDGAKYATQSGFNFTEDTGNTDISKEAKKASQTQYRLLYEKKYFNRKGTYHLRLCRYSPKFDNYNIQSLTLRIVQLPEE